MNKEKVIEKIVLFLKGYEKNVKNYEADSTYNFMKDILKLIVLQDKEYDKLKKKYEELDVKFENTARELIARTEKLCK